MAKRTFELASPVLDPHKVTEGRMVYWVGESDVEASAPLVSLSPVRKNKPLFVGTITRAYNIVRTMVEVEVEDENGY